MAFPRQYGRYVLEERIAMGGMAEIFRARTAQAGFEKRVCIKRVLPHFLEDEEFVTMFRDEARTAAKLQHANVVQVFDFGEVDDGNGVTLFLAMELVEGCDLRRIAEHSRKKKIPFELGEVAQIGIEMCRGLHHAHSLQEGGKPLGIVHRDVSPHNILVSRSGEVKVTDFGIAKAAERATHTSTGIVKGKVSYMSPEQAEGKEFDHRLDQWAVGVVLWELLCGERLFKGENDATILRKVLNVEVPQPSTLRANVPEALEDIILRALRGEPEERFPNLRQMELALSRFLFSGVVDPATAEVQNVFPRIVDAGAGQEQSKRTNVLPNPSMPQAIEPPKTERLEDIKVQSSTNEDGPVASSSSDESAVFVSSSGSKAAPGPSLERSRSNPQQAAPTMMADDPQLFDDAVAAFDAKQKSSTSQKNLKTEASTSTPRVQVPRPPSNRDNVETVLAEGMLQAEADRVDTLEIAQDEGTPATRTLVPAVNDAKKNETETLSGKKQKAPASLAPVAAPPSSSKTPLYAAGGILGAGVVVAIAIIVSGETQQQQQPVAPPPPPPAAVTTPVEVKAPPPPPVEPPPPPPPVETAPPVETPPPPVETPKPKATPTTTTQKQPKEEEKPGSVFVDVPGSWANVFIGKNPMGQTPVTLQLKPGKYNITLRNDDTGQKKTVPVTIISGVKTKIDAPF